MCGCCCGKDEEGEKAELTNPIKNRGCTDILVLLVFIAFWAGMIYIAVFSIGHGDAFRLVYGYDSFGNTCDEDNTDRKIENVSLSGMNMKGKEFVFFLDITNPKKSMRLCVNRCPDTEITTIDNLKTYAKSESINLCRYDVSYENYSENSLCPKLPVMASDNILNYCIPKSWTSFATPVQNGLLEYLNKFDVFYKVVRELCMIWRKILILCFVALGFAAAMVLLIRFFARIIVWVIVTLAIVGSIVATAFLWWTYFDIKSTISEQKDTGKIPILDIQYDSEEAFLIYSIIATVLTVVLLLVLLIMRKRISLVVALFHEAGECVAFMPCILLHPVFTFVVLVFFFAYWIIVLAYLSTSEKARLGDDGFVTYDEHEMVSYFWWYHLIGLIWTSEFIVACQQLVVSGAVASWYFARDKEDVNCALCTATSLLIFHHLGSVAFGAFIITLVKLPRWILMYINKKLKKSENDCARYCLKCCICCLWCLEKCLKYLNQNAYTVVAIRGSNFCSSAKKAFLTLLKNSLRVVAINSVGDFILFLGKIGVMAATAAVGIIWLKDSTGLHYYPIPVLLTCVFAFFVAHCFLSTYEMVIDAIFLCFCEDCEINDGSADRPFYASLRLQKFIEESSRNFNTLSKPDTGGETETAKV